MRRLVVLSSLLVTLLPLPAVAEQQVKPLPPKDTTETNRPAIIPFLEGTDVFWTLVKRDALDKTLDNASVFFPNKLEANIFPHLVFYQSFTDILNIDDQIDRATLTPGEDIKERAMVFSATPAVRIRMLRDRSAPVRTPSYMPRGNFQFFFVRGLKDARVKNASAANKAEQKKQKPNSVAEFFRQMRDIQQVSIWEAHVIGGHHSNGQDGCLSTDQRVFPPAPAKDGECIPAGIVPTAETMNRIDGSFSSAFFFRFGGNYSKNWMRLESDILREKEPETGADKSVPTEPDDIPQAFREARFSAEYEWHPRQLVADQMRDIYGRHRANLGAAFATRGISWCQRRFEVSGGVIWNPGVVDPELNWTGRLQASCFPWNNGGWGFFARWYAGQDYYNVGFLDDINRLQVGMTFNQAEFFKFRRRPKNAKN